MSIVNVRLILMRLQKFTIDFLFRPRIYKAPSELSLLTEMCNVVTYAFFFLKYIPWSMLFNIIANK